MNKKKTLLENKGITLVAIVVTIVVLLILAGISISLVLGNSGILNKANTAANDNNSASAKEKVQMLLADFGIEKYSNGNNDLLSYLNVKKANGDIDDAEDNNDGTLTVEVDGYDVVVKTDDLSIVSVDKAGGIRPKVQTSLYQTDGTAIADGTKYDKLAVTVKVLNKADLTSVDSIVLKDSDGTEVTKEINTIGDNTADASFIVTESGIYTATVTGTKDGITKGKIVQVIVNQIAVRAGLNVGDYIDYAPDNKQSTPYTLLTAKNTGSTSNSSEIKQDSLKWQILKINEDESMDIIGTPTSQDITFKSAVGFNNGVYIMNDICKSLYSKTSAGITARSVRLDDFEYWLNKSTSGVAARANSAKGSTNEYENVKTYYGNNSYIPDVYNKTENISDPYYSTPTTNTCIPASGTVNSDNKLEIKSISYSIDINQDNYAEGYKALYNDTATSFMASRQIQCNTSFAYFGFYYANKRSAGNNVYTSSDDTQYSSSARLRPVVTLGSKVKVQASSTASSSTGTAHKITQY